MTADDRSAGCTLLHVDMDAFFASVVIRDRPDLVGLPVVIGGGGRSVVLCATYPARGFGVHAGMPMTQARRLCPGAVVVPPDYTDFQTVSRSVMEVFRRITPDVQALSLDEAFLDVSGSLRRHGSPLRIAERLRAQVWAEQRITCSVGIATAPSVAKVASRRAKPDGVVVVPPDGIAEFLGPLDVGDLWGVGPATKAALNRLGLVTVRDVARTSRSTLQHALGRHAGAHVHALATGTDSRTVRLPRSFVVEETPDKSIGHEETFGRDTAEPAVIERELLRLAGKVGRRLRAARLTARTVSVRIRFSDFTTVGRSHTLPGATDVSGDIHAVAAALYRQLAAEQSGPDGLLRPRRIRLVGVRATGLGPRDAHRQLVLGERAPGWPEADQAVDAATERFGRGAVAPATLLVGRPPRPRMRRTPRRRRC